MPVPRNIEPRVRAAATQFPVVTITGPRQSGKTTLCRAVFADLPYATLESPDVREFASTDPRGFLAQYPDGAVLDEIQRVPELASYLQAIVDDDPTPGRFVLTGSENLALTHTVSQSLAGRSAVFHLLPLSASELRRFESAPHGLWATVFAGGYPAIHDRRIPPPEWLAAYTATYVERDVRHLHAIGNLAAFTRFLGLAAARTATIWNASSLGADAGIDHKTAGAWLSVLEASWLCVRVPAWHRNIGKRLVKSPKVHWLDSGLVCHLLGIRSAEQLEHHPLRGAIFESWLAAELMKAWQQRRVGAPPITHLSQNRRVEADLVIEDGATTTLIEAKSGATVAGAWFSQIEKAAELVREGLVREGQGAEPGMSTRSVVVYGGADPQRRELAEVVPWDRAESLVVSVVALD